MQQERFARHGGVHFENIASPAEINQYVKDLPEDKRESMFEVLHELNNAGLIRFMNDGVWADGEGEIGGSDDC